MTDDERDIDERIRRVVRSLQEDALIHLVLNVDGLAKLVDARLDARNRELVAQVEKLLQSHPGSIECPLADGGGGDPSVLHALIGGGKTGRATPLRELRLWVKGATRLMIADPYFGHGNPTGWRWSSLTDPEKVAKAEGYAEEVRQVLGDVKEVDIFHLPGPPKELQTAMRGLKDGRHVAWHETTEIHDRVWIRDGTDARVIGTSFGGMGGKLAFMLLLPDDDRQAFQTELTRIKKPSV